MLKRSAANKLQKRHVKLPLWYSPQSNPHLHNCIIKLPYLKTCPRNTKSLSKRIAKNDILQARNRNWFQNWERIPSFGAEEAAIRLHCCCCSHAKLPSSANNSCTELFKQGGGIQMVAPVVGIWRECSSRSVNVKLQGIVCGCWRW